MRLLFDQNLSPRLVRALADLYPSCSTSAIERMLRDHVADILAFHTDPEAAFLALT